MKIPKREFEYLCLQRDLDAGDDPIASWRKIQEYYCSQLAYVVCPLLCFKCDETISNLLRLLNSEQTDEKMIAYANQEAAKMTEEFNKNGNKNPYDNEHPSPVDMISIWRAERLSEGAKKKKR